MQLAFDNFLAQPNVLLQMGYQEQISSTKFYT